jgi:G:T/U-mismatch repair DNA glycosylase
MTENLSAKDLEHRLAITETQLNLLTQELESTKRKLTTSEARVRELNDQLENRGESSAADTATSIEARAAAVTISEPDIRPSIDTEVARITKNKAPLRIGPGSRESIITHLSRDNLVTIEHRTGGWYRIVTSDGARGWIPGDYLIFDTEMYSDSTVHVGAYDPRIEPTGGRY